LYIGNILWDPATITPLNEIFDVMLAGPFILNFIRVVMHIGDKIQILHWKSTIINTHLGLRAIHWSLQGDLSHCLNEVLLGCSYRDTVEQQLCSQLGLDEDDHEFEENDDDEAEMVYTPSVDDNHRFESNIPISKDESQHTKPEDMSDTIANYYETKNHETLPITPASQPSEQSVTVSISTIRHGLLRVARHKPRVTTKTNANIVVVESSALCDVKPINGAVVNVGGETYSRAQCVLCGAWRLAPDSTGVALDPEWVCSANFWEKVRDTCEAIEETCDAIETDTTDKSSNGHKRIRKEQSKPYKKKTMIPQP
jgi:hypothetical protein